MDALILQLRREHGAIMYLLGQVHQLGLNTPAGQQTFNHALSNLTQHLQREDGELYPNLMGLAQGNEKLLELLHMARESHIQPSLRQRFDALHADLPQQGEAPSSELVSSFTQLQEMFLQRISWEENTLFPTFLSYWRSTQRRHPDGTSKPRSP